MSNRTYWEEKAIVAAGRKLEMEAFSKSMDSIRIQEEAGILPKGSFIKEMLSEKPSASLSIRNPCYDMMTKLDLE